MINQERIERLILFDYVLKLEVVTRSIARAAENIRDVLAVNILDGMQVKTAWLVQDKFTREIHFYLEIQMIW